MANEYIKAIFDGGFPQYVPAPNKGFLPGDRTLLWGVDLIHDAMHEATDEIVYGQIVKITGYDASGAYKIAPIVNADSTPKFAVVLRTQNGAVGFPAVGGSVPYKALPHIPLSVWVIGLGATPEKDQNGEVVLAYSGSEAVGTDLTGTALYTPKLSVDTTGVNGTATSTSASNLALGLVAMGEVFTLGTNKMIRARVGGK